ncbi:hypothetical protein [Nonomuraea sp. NPDC049758]|uniref:hypothetical protein n=1 Tax=Nonomuraea sp. NPDC049758 TaxID=3154360 RepID=UPI0034329018
MDVVYVKTSCVVRWSQGQSPLAQGEVWDAEADLVAERPDLFTDEPTLVRGRPATAEPPVETATAAPGEKRTTRKPAARTRKAT